MYNLKDLSNSIPQDLSWMGRPSVVLTFRVGPILRYCPYVQGIKFWLDGIQKGNSSGNWVDLIGGKVFTNTGCIVGDNHWYFNNTYKTAATCYFTNSDTMNYPSTTSTIEIVYESEINDYFCLFITKTSGSVCFGTNGTGTQYISSVGVNKATGVRTSGPEKRIISIAGTTIIRDGVSISTTTANCFGTVPSTNAIGYSPGATTWAFKGKVYCIRIYDRQLTQEEIIYNQKIDNLRFNLGLEATNPGILYSPRMSRDSNATQGKIDDEIIVKPGGEISKP